jgi:hypothetical protein
MAASAQPKRNGLREAQPSRRGAAIVAAATIAACSATPAAADVAGTPPHVTIVDDAMVGRALLGRFDYVGSWQHVHGKHDGRSNGTSTRSTHVGDVAIFRFTGTRVRIYGVRGPSGGRGGIALDESSTGGRPIEFYAPRLEPHVLVYESPVLPAGVHTVSIAVWGTRDRHGHFYYVNIDGAEFEL